MNCLSLKKSNCQNCYKCIRHCPVKSIKFQDNQAHIINEDCILCGMCFMVCPQNAKQIRNDIDIAKALISSNKKVIVSLAPSFVANYDNANITSMDKALKKLGFDHVEETAIGADIVTQEYQRIINEENPDVLITSCCHSINMLIQKYFPEALKYLAPVSSPMQAHCAKIKKENPDCYTVFIGPCISKKDEIEKYPGIVDCVLTFEELSIWLNEENIKIEVSEETGEKLKARFYPTTGGILKTMLQNTDYEFLAIDGVENSISALKDILNGNIKKCFIEMSACVGSCINGPAINKLHRLPIKDYILVSKYAGNASFKNKSLTSKELHKKFDKLELSLKMPTEIEIRKILNEMGKTTKIKELNCGSCGYNTCREKAIAIYNNKANITMCLPYLSERAESFSDTVISNTPNAIIVIDEELNIQLFNQAACELFNIKNSNEVIGESIIKYLDPEKFIKAMYDHINTKDEKIYLPEYQKHVMQSVVYDKNYHIIMSIMKDITEGEKQKELKEKISKNSIEITDKVIEKQMRVVQEIASLLGETTAETKVALTNLKETLKNE